MKAVKAASEVYFDAFSQSLEVYEPDKRFVLQRIISPEAPWTHRSPTSYGGIGVEVNILLFSRANARASLARAKAFATSES